MENKLINKVFKNINGSTSGDYAHAYQSTINSKKDFNKFLSFINKDEYSKLEDDQFKIGKMNIDSTQEFKKGGFITYLEFEFEDKVTAIEFKEYLEEIIEDRIGIENIEFNITYGKNVITGINSVHVQFPNGIKILYVDRKQNSKAETVFNFEFQLISIINLKIEVKRQLIYTKIEDIPDEYENKIGCVQIIELD